MQTNLNTSLRASSQRCKLDKSAIVLAETCRYPAVFQSKSAHFFNTKLMTDQH